MIAYVIECDGCESEFPRHLDLRRACLSAASHGWVSQGNFHWCPECWAENAETVVEPVYQEVGGEGGGHA